ncbi:MAG: amidohydrolase family protein, partial [Myxococcota bacterium]
MTWWLIACREVEEPTPPPDPVVQPADLVVTGARFRTMDPVPGEGGSGGPETAEAVAVRDGVLVYVGDAAGVEAFVGADTARVTLDGATVLPGFTDAHNHLLWSGADLLLVDLYAAKTLDAFARRVTDWAAANPDEPWVQGGGWDLTTFLDLVDAAVLDGMVADRPVYLYSADAHSAVVNTRALAIAGIDATTPDPADGTIVRDADGAPTGLLLEGAMTLVEDHLPAYSDALADQGLRDAQAEANGYGVTNVVDPLIEEWMLAGYQRAADAGTLTVRIHGAAYVDAADPDPVPAVIALRDRYHADRLELNAAKLFLDGVLETGTAVLLAPYVDGHNGVPVFDDARLQADAIALDAAGFQLHAHVIGDGAVRQFLDAVEAVEAANGPRDRRPLAAHLELIDPADRPRFAALGVLADAQGLWAYPDSYVRDLTWPVIGPERSDALYPFGSTAAAGATIVGGSDWSVTSQNPFEAIEVLVRRKNPWRDAALVLNEAEALDLTTALRAYTDLGARASFSEDSLGTLTVGKRADFVVLDRDPYEVPVEALSDLVVTSTWVDGVEVYRLPADGRRPAGAPALRPRGCPGVPPPAV